MTEPRSRARFPVGLAAHWKLVLSAAITFCVCAFGGALASGAISPRPQSTPADRRQIMMSERRAVAPSLVHHFAVFRHPTGRKAAVAADSHELTVTPAQAAWLSGSSFDLDTADAAWITPPGGPGVWVVPGTNGACIITQRDVQYCGGLGGPGSPDTGGFFGMDGPAGGSDEKIEQTGPNSYKVKLTSSAPPSGTYTLYGLVPDGNASVTISLVDGASFSAPVKDNVYSIQVPGPPAAISDVDADGTNAISPVFSTFDSQGG